MGYERHLQPEIYSRAPQIQFAKLALEQKYRTDTLMRVQEAGGRDFCLSILSAFYARCTAVADFTREVVLKELGEDVALRWQQPSFTVDYFVDAALNVFNPPHVLDALRFVGCNHRCQQVSLGLFTETNLRQLMLLADSPKIVRRCAHS
jgi:hypothetical protein